MQQLYTSRTFRIAGVAAILILIGSLIPLDNNLQAYHNQSELDFYKQHSMLLVIDSTQLFPSAKQCTGCHGHDFENYAMVDRNGKDVNIEDAWRSSIMANAAKDPFWKAKVSHEVLVNPSHAADIETTCISCHAPMGHNTAILRGKTHYTMADLSQDTIGLDGISCGACHQISADQIGELNTGKVNYDTTRVQFGPYPQPFGAPMSDFVGFDPVYSEHINDAGLCASCHTLVNETLDLNGEKTGNFFVEQATYHEWLNSRYETDSVSCQACHMPRLDDTIVIADNLLFLKGRSPYALHDMAGANTFMLQMMRDNKSLLGIDAEERHFDSSIAVTYRMLQHQSLDLQLDLNDLTMDSAFFQLNLFNKAGHKFPSGYPSRRAYVEFVMVSKTNDTLFHSGKLMANQKLAGHHPHYEEHFDMINAEDQVQIYEIVNGDMNQQFTTVLERAYQPLKDNRIPPQGFTTSHQVYDTTLIAGKALQDVNFNIKDAVEGSGADDLYYHIPISGFSGQVDVYARVYYQSMPLRWLEEMFDESTTEINFFKALYNNTQQDPVLIGEAVLKDILINFTSVHTPDDSELLKVYPNPTQNAQVYWSFEGNKELNRIRIYSADGRLINILENPGKTINLPTSKGIYFLQFEFEGVLYNRRIVRK